MPMSNWRQALIIIRKLQPTTGPHIGERYAQAIETNSNNKRQCWITGNFMINHQHNCQSQPTHKVQASKDNKSATHQAQKLDNDMRSSIYDVRKIQNFLEQSKCQISAHTTIWRVCTMLSTNIISHVRIASDNLTKLHSVSYIYKYCKYIW